MFNKIGYKIGYFLGGFTATMAITIFIMPMVLFARLFCTQETRDKLADWIESL